jgi:hypothetical protein
MATQNLKVRSGNRLIVQLDGKQVGLLQSVRMSDDYGPEPASGIGDIHVQEYVPTMARHTISVSAMVLNVGSLREAGIAVENGDGALQGLVFDIVTQSKDDGTVLRKYVGCSYASGDVDVSKHSIVMNSGTFNCLDVTGNKL